MIHSFCEFPSLGQVFRLYKEINCIYFQNSITCNFQLINYMLYELKNIIMIIIVESYNHIRIKLIALYKVYLLFYLSLSFESL